MRTRHLEWATDEMKREFARRFSHTRMVSKSEFDAFWAQFNLAPEQVHEMRLRFIENLGGIIRDDTAEKPKSLNGQAHYCPNCGVRMVEEKQ